MVLYSKQKQLGILIQMIWLFTPEAYEFPQESLSLCMESGQGELTSKHNRSLSAKHCSFPALTRIFPESNLKSRWTIPLFRRRRRRLRTLLFQENPLTNIYMHWDSYWTILTWIRTNLWQPPALPWDVSFHCAYVNWIRFVCIQTCQIPEYRAVGAGSQQSWSCPPARHKLQKAHETKSCLRPQISTQRQQHSSKPSCSWQSQTSSSRTTRQSPEKSPDANQVLLLCHAVAEVQNWPEIQDTKRSKAVCQPRFYIFTHLCTSSGLLLGSWLHLWITWIPMPLADAGCKIQTRKDQIFSLHQQKDRR